jgi:mono/diheme cytochrome c family protein
MKMTWRVAVLVVGISSAAAFAGPAVDKKTERTWKAKCASCHGADGKGDTEQGKKMKVKDMTTAEWQKAVNDEQLKKSMIDGIKTEKDGVKQEMESYKDTLTPEQMDGLVKYVRTFGPK